MNNPINFFKNMVGMVNPKDMAMKMIENSSNPMLNNLVKMANDGDTKGVEDFARNLFKEKGMDFDKEFSDFMSKYNNK